MTEFLTALAKIAAVFKDPILVVLILVIIILAYFLRRVLEILLKTISEQKELAKEIQDTNEVMAKLVTLVEVLVYGRAKK